MRDSSVIQTQKWLYKFFRACAEKSKESPYVLQCKMLCAPIVEPFPEINPEELQYELLNHGLFDPVKWADIRNQVEILEKRSIWQIVDQEYQFLKTLWKGPEVAIYIFPLNNVNLNKSEQTPTKNGVAYKGALFLFLSDGLRLEEIMALLAHEYNHVCRLNYLGVETKKIPLKDSLIIEGFGEFAVKELYGEKWLAPWTDLYSFKESTAIWTKHFIPKLNLLGTKNHEMFLYGKARSPFPKWIGYHIGYQIVDSFQKKHGPFNNSELYRKSSDELIAGSNFPAN
ncbi:hypothetical protein JSQ81_08630 [Sporosarcina sp. Marseille-Q4063]|uniref:DUF2268 domain-containing protein n=1 Tax=Sporosarcina sp. Marseille-Q4063 TaxID=2810514 RepID=UPI001BB000DA|nr:DUF2268 domain-containing putative Zn-dependent protease [Sporosarcina sp. Marseille-Q4063]QUW23550.1 hypothetical protein JSQ81_08630 [Sporosarcina sp. Marseille-Q4063]